jgi:hypothetical protein
MDSIIPLVFFGALFVSWCTHIFTCLSEDQWGFLLAGAIMFPIGVIHGFGILIGIW